MGLSAREQRTLNSIEHSLSGSDPMLASRLAIFTQLASGEKMPLCEIISAEATASCLSRPRRDRHPRTGGAGGRARTVNQRLVSRQAGLLLWLVVAIGLVVLALAVGRTGGRKACAVPWAAVCTGQSPTRSGRKLPQESGTALPGRPAPGGRVGCVPSASSDCPGDSLRNHVLIHIGLGAETIHERGAVS